jgi:antirestriction protein ArdC
MKNAITGKEYQGGNVEMLEMVKSSRGYTCGEWLTFVQAKMAGMMVTKGSKGVGLRTFIEDTKGTHPIYFTVFNLEQCVCLIK